VIPEPISFTVYGRPAPQGSKKAVGRRKNGSTILIEMSQKVKPWREAVKTAALEAYDGPTITDPVVLYVVFTLQAPAKLPKGRTYPTTAPDLSKLIRSTEDAITDAGIWRDDSLVVVETGQKLYPGQVGALDRPGATITISWIPPMTAGHVASMMAEWRSSQPSTKIPETG